MQCSLTERLVRSTMRWAGHLVRMDASKLAKRAEVEKHQGRRKRGRLQLRWEDCVRRDMRRSGRMKDGEREWLIENYGKKEQKEWLDNTLPDPHPCTAGNKEEEHSDLLNFLSLVSSGHMALRLLVIQIFLLHRCIFLLLLIIVKSVSLSWCIVCMIFFINIYCF